MSKFLNDFKVFIKENDGRVFYVARFNKICGRI